MLPSRLLREKLADSPFWHECHRRVYRDTDRFENPVFAEAAMAIALNMCHIRGTAVDIVVRNAAIASRLIQRYDVQKLFIERQLSEALLQSDPPADLHWQDINFPFPAGIIIPPRKFLSAEATGTVSFIAYAKITAGEQVELPGFDKPIRLENNGIIFFTAFYDHPDIPFLCFSLDAHTQPTIRDAIGLSFDAVNEYREVEQIRGDEEIVVRHLIKFTFSALLAAAARPEIIDARPGSMLHRGRHKKSGLDLYEPRIIGRGYMIKYSHSGGGIGSSPRPHWRRGHFRHQPYGPVKNRSFKTIWIEPTFVGKYNDG